MSRSSIFNFEALDGFHPRLPAALLAAAAIVLGVELFIRTVPDAWLIPHYSRLGFRGFMEKEVLPKFKAPKIAIVGTSRAADALMPQAIDKELGLPDFSTVNLSIFGGRTSDWLDIYRRNRAKLSQCKLLIVIVDEWTFSSGVDNDEEFCLDAPLVDRLDFVHLAQTPIPPDENPARRNRLLDEWAENLRVRFGYNLTALERSPMPGVETAAERAKRESAKLDSLRLKRNRLLVDWAFNMRLKLGYVPFAIGKSLRIAKKRELKFDEFHMVRSTSAERGEEAASAANYDERIVNYYKLFDTHPVYLHHIVELAELVRRDGGRLVLLHLPNRRTYQEEVFRLRPRGYAQHIRATSDLAARIGAPFYHFTYPEELNLADDDYVDYCHLAKTGTETCTHAIVELIKRDKLLEK